MKKIVASGIVLAFLLSLGIVFAAPDSPPSLTWNVALSDPSDCSASAATKVLSIDFDSSSNVYTFESCPQSGGTYANPKVLLVRKWAANSGNNLWSRGITCDGTPAICQGFGFKVIPGTVLVWFYETNKPLGGGANTRQQMDFINPLTGEIGLSLTGANFFDAGGTDAAAGIADGDNQYGVTFEGINATTATIYAGGSGYSVSITCSDDDSASDCTRNWERTSNPAGEWLAHAQPLQDVLYQLDSNGGGGTETLRIVNQATGDTTATAGFSGGNQEPRSPGWRLSSRHEVTVWYTDTTGNNQVMYDRLNASTLVTVATSAVPTESTISGFTNLVIQSTYLDGANSMFVCGSADVGANMQSMAMKFNTTVGFTAQRWNLTFDQTADTTQAERVTNCIISPDGGLYLAGYQTVGGSAFNSFVRKYAGAGTGRAPQDTFTGFAGSPGGGEDPDDPGFDEGDNFVDFSVGFCSDSWGFDCSWLFGILIVSLVTIGFARISPMPLLVGIGAFLGVGVSVAVGVLPMWVLFVMIFIVIAVAGFVLFGRGEDESS